ncbi:MAG: hypothetical protein ACK5LE_07950 [Alphaproteobacteria bacterium]
MYRLYAPQVIAIIGGDTWLTEDAPNVTTLLRQHHQNGGTAPVSFAAEVFKAANLDNNIITQFKNMLSAEHIFHD